ncbi:MAG: hypothetical protein ACRCX8_14245 [Sarcina sp.]
MKNALCVNTLSGSININGYKVTNIMGNRFRMSTNAVSIDFEAEGRAGATYSRITMITNKATNRQYKSSRYFTKYVSQVQSVAYSLLINNYLWDCLYKCPAIESYAWGIKPYIETCIEKGMTY